MNDRFLRACRREPVDRTPVWFMRQAGRSQPSYRKLRERSSLIEIVSDPALCAQVTLRPVEELGVDAAVLFADITLPFSSMAVPFELADGGPRILRPIRSAQDVAALRPFQADDIISAVFEAIGLIRRQSSVPLIGFAGAPFTLASYLIEGGPSREYMQTKTLMYRQPSVWRALMDLLTEMTVGYLLGQVRAGVHAVQLFDSWAGCLSPADYGEYVAPYTGRIFAALAATGVPTIHFGTATAGLLGQMAAAGGDVIGVDWRINLDHAWQMIGSERGIQGNLEPAVLLGPFEAVAARARDVLQRAAGRRGHIFNLGHGVPPDTPREALRRLVDLVHAYAPEMERTVR